MGENSRVMHFGRSFHDTRLEDDCPCAKAPCGLVSDDKVNPECLEHPWGRVKTIRQRHWADDCPKAHGPVRWPPRTEGVVNAVMVFRCDYCGWSTTRYSEIDGHEDQIEPGHLVTGAVEDINRDRSLYPDIDRAIEAWVNESMHS